MVNMIVSSFGLSCSYNRGGNTTPPPLLFAFYYYTPHPSEILGSSIVVTIHLLTLCEQTTTSL